MKQVTLLFLRRENQILLAMKKRGFGKGMWNGPGGKTEPGESVIDAATRECQEEIGVTPINPRLAGHLRFTMPEDAAFGNDCYIFVTRQWDGDPTESEEMQPQWFDVTKLPYDNMWPDDTIWMPHLIAGELFEGDVHTSHDKLISHSIKIVPSL
jgi:mutator protein MutT